MIVLAASDLWASPPGASEPVVRGASLELAEGEWVAISGPNGGGKTTLALALAGLRPIQRGRVTLGTGIAANARDRRHLAVILQDPSAQLFCPSVREELAYTARNLGHEPKQVAESVLRLAEQLGLEDDLPRDPHQLSAGRQQLVLIAAALVSAPRVLIADEPGAHLDPTARERVLEAIRERVSEGLAVLWLTQAERELEAADRVIWIGASPLPPRPREADPRVPAAVAGVAAQVQVAAWNGEDGPAVRSAGALEFDLPARGVTVFLGPNGAGKSVLLRSLCGIEPGKQVQARWLGANGPIPLLVSQYPEQQLFQELVSDELAFAAVSRGVPREAALERAAASLAALGLGQKTLERRCWDLSSGERRLIEVVAGLIAPARLLALDEPSAGLDPARREALSGLIRSRAESGPVVVASQDREWAGQLGGWVRSVGQDGDKCLPSISKKTD